MSLNYTNTQAIENSQPSTCTRSVHARHSLTRQYDRRSSGGVTLTERFICVGCATVIAHSDVAVAVRLVFDCSWTRSLRGNINYGWACAPCAKRPATPTTRTYLDDGFWSSYPAVDPALQCEGCGQLVRLRTHHRRSRVLCSNACRVRTSASRRVRTISACANECQLCGETVVATRSSRLYCSSVCRQRAYRIRTASKSILSLG